MLTRSAHRTYVFQVISRYVGAGGRPTEYPSWWRATRAAFGGLSEFVDACDDAPMPVPLDAG